jgi:hypothetical protein
MSAVPVAAGRFRTAGSFDVEVDAEPDMPYDATLSVEMHDGRYVCTALQFRQREGGPPVTAAGMRAVPIAAWVRRAVEAMLTERAGEDGSPSITLRPIREPVRGRRRRRGEDADLAAVAYAIAQMCGEPPTKAVAERLEVPLGTARRLVAQAREAGLIPPAS